MGGESSLRGDEPTVHSYGSKLDQLLAAVAPLPGTWLGDSEVRQLPREYLPGVPRALSRSLPPSIISPSGPFLVSSGLVKLLMTY